MNRRQQQRQMSTPRAAKRRELGPNMKLLAALCFVRFFVRPDDGLWLADNAIAMLRTMPGAPFGTDEETLAGVMLAMIEAEDRGESSPVIDFIRTALTAALRAGLRPSEGKDAPPARPV